MESKTTIGKRRGESIVSLARVRVRDMVRVEGLELGLGFRCFGWFWVMVRVSVRARVRVSPGLGSPLTEIVQMISLDVLKLVDFVLFSSTSPSHSLFA